jgi:hypothetical protein
MRAINDRSLAYDLADTNIESPESLTALIIDHCLAPVRASCGLPAPRLGERDDFAYETERLPDGTPYRKMRRYTLTETPAFFDVVLRAMLLFGWLFPESCAPSQNVAMMLSEPGWCVLDDWITLAHRPYEGISDLVRGLFGLPREYPDLYMGTGYHIPAVNEAGIAELRGAREIVFEALSPVPEDLDSSLIDVGLQRFEFGFTRKLDRILRTSVHRRMIWFGTFEVGLDEGDDHEPYVTDQTISLERGVFAAMVPETLTGLVVLDLSEQLSLGRHTGLCAHCHGLMPLTARQAGRARRGEAVYHSTCLDEHRLIYFRDYQRQRYRRPDAQIDQ